MVVGTNGCRCMFVTNFTNLLNNLLALDKVRLQYSIIEHESNGDIFPLASCMGLSLERSTLITRKEKSVVDGSGMPGQHMMLLYK